MLLLILIACGRAVPEPPVTGTPHPEVPSPAFFLAEGAPDPTACAVDADCIGDTVPTVDGCCNEPRRLLPHARAYREWVRRWRVEHCAEATCPPPPNPYRPPECAFEVRCEDRVCVDACPR